MKVYFSLLERFSNLFDRLNEFQMRRALNNTRQMLSHAGTPLYPPMKSQQASPTI
jgi:hypothetical protein